MRSGLCSYCKTALTAENSKPSTYAKKAGYCRACYKIKRGPGKCHACKVVFDENNSNESTLKIGRGKCRDCENLEYQKKSEIVKQRAERWAANNPEKCKRSKVAYQRKRYYGISQEEFERKFQLQNGLCAICEEPIVIATKAGTDANRRRACQDHDHKSGKIRDLLCSNCNLLLSNCQEKEEILVRAARYLQKHADGSSNQTVCDDAQVLPVAS